MEYRGDPTRRAYVWLGAVLATILAARLLVLTLGPLGLGVDEMQYWVWAQDLAAGYFSKPPLIAWAIAATTSVCGDGPACTRLPAVLAHAVTPVFVFLLGRDLYGPRSGLLAGLVFATLPGSALSGLLISTDSLLLACWAAGLWFWWRALQAGGMRWWAGFGIALGLGVEAKYAMAYLPVCLALHLAVSAEARSRLSARGLALAGLAAGILIAPNLAWNVANGFVTFGHTAANANLGGLRLDPAGALAFLGGQLGVFGPAAFAGLIWLLVRRTRWCLDEPQRFLVMVSVPILVLMVAQGFISRANANWAAPAYVGASILLAAGLARLAPTWGATSLGINTLVFVLVLVGFGLGRIPFMDPQAGADPFKALRGWAELADTADAAARQAGVRVFLGDERDQVVALLYHRRGDAPVVRKWNGDGVVQDHFDLRFDLSDRVGDDVLLITRGEGADVFARAFTSVEPAGVVTPLPYAAPDRTYRLFVLRGFRGYP